MSSDNPTGADNQQERPGVAQWVVGFVDGEGCFSVPIFRNPTCANGWQVQPQFTVVQSMRSQGALHLLKTFFGCGQVRHSERCDGRREALGRFTVRRRIDLLERIVPFFEAYPLITAKAEGFTNFAAVVRMMEQNVHKQVDGLVRIAHIAEQMNRRQPSRFLESSEAIRQPLTSAGEVKIWS